MSFFSDLFHGNFSNLGSDLAPSNVFSDFGSNAATAFSNPMFDVGLGLTALTAGLAAPELLGLGAADVATAGAGASLGAADVAAGGVGGFDLGTIGPGVAGATGAVDIGTPVVTGALDATSAADAALPAGATLASGPASDTANIAAIASANPDLAPGSSLIAAGGGDPSVAAIQAANPDLAAPGGLTGQVPATAAAGASNPSVMGTIGSTLKSAAPYAGAAGLGLSLYQGYEQNQALKALNAQEQQRTQQLDAIAAAATNAAQPILNSGSQLMQYLTTNTLPEGFQKKVDQAVAAAKAQRIQAAATMGQSTDPLYNTALAQDLAAIDNQGLMIKSNLETQLNQAGQQMVQTANQLLSTGATSTEIASQLPIMVQNLDIKLAQMTTGAIGAFAAAMNGGARTGTGAPGSFSISVNPSTGAVTG